MAFLLAAALTLGVLSVGSSIKAGNEQKKANNAINRIRERKASKERLAEIRQSKIQSAMVRANSANSGTSETSASEGVLSSINAQTGANLGFINSIGALQANVTRFQNKAITNQGQAQLYGAAGKLAMSAQQSGVFSKKGGG